VDVILRYNLFSPVWYTARFDSGPGCKELLNQLKLKMMENIQIKISGAGSINQVALRLYEISAKLLNRPEDTKEEVIEDSILICEIEEY